MTEPLTLDAIRSLCGDLAFKRGQSYYKQKRVTRVERDPDSRLFDAVVIAEARFKVHLELDDGDVTHMSCECADFAESGTACKHIAAVLCHIQGMHRGQADRADGPFITNEHLFRARNLISIFDRPLPVSGGDEDVSDIRFDEPERLTVEFTCSALELGRKTSFAVEMKLGVKRLYIINKIKDLLRHWDNGTQMELAKLFTFDPSAQTFSEEDREVIELLSDIARNETAFRDAYMTYSYSRTLNEDRVLFIPPYAWSKLLPKLIAAKAKFVHGKMTYEALELKDEQVPLSFRFGHPTPDVYELSVTGLEHVTVMDTYSCVLIGSSLYRIHPSTVKQLGELKSMFFRSNEHHVLISPAHLELFLSRVVPGLKQLGEVDFSPELSDRIVTSPLQAKLYLDRNGDQLWATLEYAYGEVKLDPFATKNGKPVRADRILLRDGDKENRIMSLMEQIPFQYNGKVLHLDDEEDIYHFLFHTLPQLERWTEIYATPEARSMMRESVRPPKMTVDLDSRTDWLEVRFDMDGIDDGDIRDVLKSLVEKKSYFRLSDGRFLSLEDEGFSRIGQLLADMNLQASDVKDRYLQLSIARGLTFLDADERQQGLRLGQRFREFLANIRHPDQLQFDVPESLDPIMRDYQKLGFQWMKTLANYRFGGILADDMGLGKTLQGIAFILSELEASREAGTPALIVCPASLTYNWQNELKKFAPGIRSSVMSGDKSTREGLLAELADTDVLITSYPLLRRDASEYADRRFGVLILDEAQAIKNHSTLTAQSVQELKAKIRFALTGTPVENRLEELWAIFDAVFPELFWSKRRFNELTPEQVARKAGPFILRRLKSDVLTELPDKIETVQSSELLPEQKKLYLAYLAKLQEDTVRRLREEGLHKSRMHILAGMTRLRQLCCHPAMFLENYDGESGKLEQLLEIVDECRSAGKRMLVFSQFTQMLGIIRGELEKRDVPFFYLDGQTPARERVELCARFNEGEQDLFLISLKAGGTGLNLTGADTVVLFDLWWNPAVEQQAADRAHRIGQKNVVQVIRMVTQGTIEEKMYELQERKRNLIDAVIKPGEETLASMDEDDIRELLMI
ncbi:SNF2 helicase associated domain-containing protein [Cohnella faecalis]|uniref:Helicase SNF n=1 Tax=Cohnella faecalis TaxID=2315694 RepID=A0A398CQ22_9BACL|nr:DEAD/DEAH box helicase [Cohnella faecalis]RIE04542.1 helicase SNF [Cohnella faecalis]